jgi:hypothetical protein
LRRYLAYKEVAERVFVFKALIKIQSFVRMVIAKRKVQKIRERKENKELKK